MGTWHPFGFVEHDMEASTTTPAAFWQRAIAFVIDFFLLMLANMFLIIPLATVLGLRESKGTNEVRSAFVMFLLGAYLVTTIIIILGAWLYNAYMESSRMEATLGKKLMGIRVTDMDGGRVSFQTASIRFFGKIISIALAGAGFIMAPFTPNYQALHDVIAKTIVVKYKKLTPQA
jgi:uncharacterized RDD family membrane protein YckC